MAPGREVEYRPDSGAPFAHLQWNKNRLRALPTSWKALGQSGNTQGSPASFPGHAPWLPARWSGSSRRDTSQRVGTYKSDIGPGKKNCRYGRKHSHLRQHFGSDVKLVNHPFLGPLTSDEWRRFHCVHGRHHLRQIRRACDG